MLICSAAYGRTVGLDVAAPAVAAVRAVLPFWWTDAALDPEHVRAVPAAHDARQAVRDLELWVAEHAENLVFVHAAAVAVGDRAVLLPGRTFTGKTTVCAALLRAGAAYLSDEYAVLDASGLVHPYPRPLAVRGPADRHAVPAEQLGATTVGDRLPVAAVVTLRYGPGSTWSVTPTTPAAAVLRLLENTVCARSRPEEALVATRNAVAGARCYAGVRGEADDAAERLLTLVDQG